MSPQGFSSRRPARDEIDPVLMRWCISLALAALMAGAVMNIVSTDGQYACEPGESKVNLVGAAKGLSIATLVAAVVFAVLQQTGKLTGPPRRMAHIFLGLAATTTALALGVTLYLDRAGDPMCSPF